MPSGRCMGKITPSLDPQAVMLQGIDLHVATQCFMREFWDLDNEPELPLTEAQRALFAAAGQSIHQDMPHCEQLPDNTRICFSRFNEGPDLLNVGLPLVYELHGRPEDIVVVNFGHWHSDETAYRWDCGPDSCHASSLLCFPCHLWTLRLVMAAQQMHTSRAAHTAGRAAGPGCLHDQACHWTFSAAAPCGCTTAALSAFTAALDAGTAAGASSLHAHSEWSALQLQTLGQSMAAPCPARISCTQHSCVQAAAAPLCGALHPWPRSNFPHMMWRETTPQHYATPDGMYTKEAGLGTVPFTCRPTPDVTFHKDGSLSATSSAAEGVLRGTWRNVAAREILQPAGIPFISGW